MASFISAKPVILDKSQKCITCGGPIPSNPKRKGPKLIRCENCIAQDSVEQRNNQSMYFTSFLYKIIKFYIKN